MAEQLDLQRTIFEGLCYGLLIPLIFDNIIVRHVVVEKARYFALHVIFNSWLTYIVFEDAMDGMLNPQNAYKPLHVYSSVMMHFSSVMMEHAVFFQALCILSSVMV